MSQFAVDIYLKQRSAEERIQEATRETARIQRSHDWITEYHKRGHRTAFNWSPTITATTTEETTSEEAEKEVVGEPAQQDRSGRPEELEGAQGQEGERRFDRADGDTPF